MLNIQLHRGTTAEIEQFVGKAGSLVIDSTTQRMYIHDGVQAGGYPVLDVADLDRFISDLNSLDMEGIDGLTAALAAKIAIDQLGVAGGIATLDNEGHVPASQLPNFIVDVEDVATQSELPVEGRAGTLYIVKDDNKVFRWGETAYFEITATPVSTDFLEEGVTNLYFSIQDTREALSASGDLSYDSATGVLSYTTPIYTLEGLGLDQVENFGMASESIAIEGQSETHYMSPLRAQQFLEGVGIERDGDGYKVDEGELPWPGPLEAPTMMNHDFDDGYEYVGPQFTTGTTAENDGWTMDEGTMTVDTDQNEARIHDGETQGGYIV